MEWTAKTPFSKKDDFWLNTAKHMNERDLKVEASLAIAFAIAEGDYKTAEDIAFSWIDIDHFHNKLGKAYMVEVFLMEYLKFTKLAIDRMIQKIWQEMRNTKQ